MDTWQAIRYTELMEKSGVSFKQNERNLHDLYMSLSVRLSKILYTGRI